VIRDQTKTNESYKIKASETWRKNFKNKNKVLNERIMSLKYENISKQSVQIYYDILVRH